MPFAAVRDIHAYYEVAWGWPVPARHQWNGGDLRVAECV